MFVFRDEESFHSRMKSAFLGDKKKNCIWVENKIMIWEGTKTEKWARLRSPGDFLECLSVGFGLCPVRNDWEVIERF